MPEDTQTKHESTDLIDVSDVASELDEVTPAHIVDRERPKPVAERSRNSSAVEGHAPASLKDRFAAFTIDLMILYALYWPLMLVYRTVAFGQTAGPIPGDGTHGLIFHGIVLLITFLYFFLCESVFFATAGKFLCRLRVRRTDGAPISIMTSFVRNLIRPLDIILLPVLIPVACMEWTRNGSRLGDIVARTKVIRTLNQTGRTYSLTLDMLPSASARVLAFLIDLALFALLIVGYALLLTPQQPIFSLLLVVYAPIVCVLFFFVQEAALTTSLGKWLFGYTICQEDGTSVDVSGSLVRTLFRPVDMNPIGYLCTLLSIRKQRPGDVAAGTVLCKVPRRLKSLIGIAIVVIIAVAVAYGGASNRDNFLSSSFQINFLPSFELQPGGAGYSVGEKGILAIRDFQFAAGDAKDIRRPAIFQPGETVYLVFSVQGGALTNGILWIQEDLTVRYPDGNTGLKLENIIDFREKLKQTGPIAMTNNIALPGDAMPGRYTVSIVLRDKHTNRQLNEQRFFYVTPRGEVAPSPETIPVPSTPPPAS